MVSFLQVLLISAACLSTLSVEAKVVFYEDFSKPLNVNASGSNFTFFTRKTVVANDGKFVPNHNKTLTQDIRPFKKTVPYGPTGIADHFKQIVLQKNYWNVSKTQVLTCELKTWSKQWGVAGHPFKTAVTDPYDDIRLATCGLYVGDPQTFTLAHFLQSVRLHDMILLLCATSNLTISFRPSDIQG